MKRIYIINLRGTIIFLKSSALISRGHRVGWTNEDIPRDVHRDGILPAHIAFNGIIHYVKNEMLYRANGEHSVLDYSHNNRSLPHLEMIALFSGYRLP